MGIFSAIVLFPLAPVRGVIALGELIQRQVDQQTRNPAVVRKQLEELEEARERGEISPEEEDEAQDEVLGSIVAPAAADTTSDKDE
jgi:cytochrome c-type biogenesis protein CcmI